jgi:thioredoxin-related protein
MNCLKIAIIFFFISVNCFAQNINITSFYEGPFEDVLKESKRINKPIFLDFTSATCKHCLKMEKETFANPTIAENLNNNFIAYKVDLEDVEGKNIARKYSIVDFPSYMILDQKNNKLGIIKGFYQAYDFKKALDKIMKTPQIEKPAKKKRKFFGLFS